LSEHPGAKPGARQAPLEGEIKLLEKYGYDPHELKPGKHGACYDLFKDREGWIYIKPSNGSGEGEPIYVNINDISGGGE
jgi:hypothetical protein